MSNSQTVPATAIKVSHTISGPFRRAKQMIADISAANLLQGMARQLAIDNIGSYWSRGKGKGKPARSAKKQARDNYSCNHYPFSSDRQDSRIERTQHMVIVNGFELMQMIPSRDRVRDFAKAA
jgi:hypothetical protein